MPRLYQTPRQVVRLPGDTDRLEVQLTKTPEVTVVEAPVVEPPVSDCVCAPESLQWFRADTSGVLVLQEDAGEPETAVIWTLQFRQAGEEAVPFVDGLEHTYNYIACVTGELCCEDVTFTTSWITENPASILWDTSPLVTQIGNCLHISPRLQATGDFDYFPNTYDPTRIPVSQYGVLTINANVCGVDLDPIFLVALQEGSQY